MRIICGTNFSNKARDAFNVRAALAARTDSELTLVHVVEARQSKGCNVAFCDGHVALVRRRELTSANATARFFNIDNEPHPELQFPGLQ